MAKQSKKKGKTEETHFWRNHLAVIIVSFLIGAVIGAAIAAAVTLSVVNARKSTSSGENTEASEKGDEYNLSDCITLGDYRGITVSIAVTDEDVEDEIEDLIDENTGYEELSGIATEGDTLYIEFEGYIKGERMEDTCGEDYLTIGAGEWLDGFEEAFIGVKTGTTISFSIDVPKGTYGDDALDGKTIDFTATALYLCGEEIVPEYTDEFVREVTEYDSMEEYEAAVRKELLADNEEDKLDTAWDEVIDGCKVHEYPEVLMEAARQEVLNGYYDMANLYGVTPDEMFQMFGSVSEEYFVENDLDELAEDTVVEYLAAQAIAENEGLSYTDKEYDDYVEKMYSSRTDRYSSKNKYESENRDYLEQDMLITVVQEWIGQNATFVTE